MDIVMQQLNYLNFTYLLFASGDVTAMGPMQYLEEAETARQNWWVQCSLDGPEVSGWVLLI